MENHSTAPWWCKYEDLPFPVQGELASESEGDAGEELAQRVHQATGEMPTDTEALCVLCLQNINTADDVAVSNRCQHHLHSTCCSQWFSSEAFPQTVSDIRNFCLTELIPMGPCPNCRTVGRWKGRHNNQFIPSGKPVYAIHKFYAINYARGGPVRGNLSRVTHIHSAKLCAAIDSCGSHMTPTHYLHRDDLITNISPTTKKLGYKMYRWSLSNSTHCCCKCKKDRPWTSLYKWNNCALWCHSVKCMECSTQDRYESCPVCYGNGSLEDYRGSPFARNTRGNSRQSRNGI